MKTKPNLKNVNAKIQNLAEQISQLKQQLDDSLTVIYRQRQQLEEKDEIIFELREKIKALETKAADQNSPAKNRKKESKNIAGWTVRKGSDGYYRAHKTICKKSYGVYVGKQIDQKTKTKVMAREKLILEKLQRISC